MAHSTSHRVHIQSPEPAWARIAMPCRDYCLGLHPCSDWASAAWFRGQPSYLVCLAVLLGQATAPRAERPASLTAAAGSGAWEHRRQSSHSSVFLQDGAVARSTTSSSRNWHQAIAAAADIARTASWSGAGKGLYPACCPLPRVAGVAQELGVEWTNVRHARRNRAPLVAEVAV